MINIQKARLTTLITIIISIISLYAAIIGITDKNLYNDLLNVGSITQFLITGSLAQDIISIPAGVLLFLLSVLFLIRPGYKSFIAILGLSGYFFYGYGLYVIQGQYTSIYLAYLAIFGLSIYSLIWGLLSFEKKIIADYNLPKVLRISIAVFLLFIILVLVPIWLIRILPDIAKHVPGETYGVFILDLGIVFPALGIIATKLLRKKPFGNILAGVALIKALTICLSVAFGEWYLAFNSSRNPDYGMISIFSTLTIISTVLLFFYLLKYKKDTYMGGGSNNEI